MMTVNELYKILENEIAKGNGDFIVTAKGIDNKVQDVDYYVNWKERREISLREIEPEYKDIPYPEMEYHRWG